MPSTRPPLRPLIAKIANLGLLLTQACGRTPMEVNPPGTPGTPAPAAILVGAGNIAACDSDNDEATAKLLDGIPGTVVALGDNAFPHGSLADYRACYGPSWGRHLSRTRVVLGNHDYDSSATAAGAFDYFGNRVGPRPQGYYSFELGAWHVIVLNDEGQSFAAGSAQERWLVNDLAAHQTRCMLAMWHVPLFLSSNVAGYTVNDSRKVLWDWLYAAGVDVVLNGQEHHYERMAPMRPDGTWDDAHGIRQFNVGTGGESVALPTAAIHPNSEVRAAVFGVLKLTLEPDSYSWEFVPVAGESFTDSGTGSCDGSS